MSCQWRLCDAKQREDFLFKTVRLRLILENKRTKMWSEGLKILGTSYWVWLTDVVNTDWWAEVAGAWVQSHVWELAASEFARRSCVWLTMAIDQIRAWHVACWLGLIFISLGSSWGDDFKCVGLARNMQWKESKDSSCVFFYFLFCDMDVGFVLVA